LASVTDRCCSADCKKQQKQQLSNSTITLLVGRQEVHPACKNEWWDAGVVICLGQGADLHMAQPMPLPLTISCSSKSRLVLLSGFTFLDPDHPGSTGQNPRRP